jgi:hypothetical protein
VYPATVKTDISLNALRGDGSKYGIMTPRHQNGMSPDACAGKILEGIAVGREEIFVGLRDSDAKVQRI